MSIPATSMSLGEASRFSGISKGTISKAIASGKLSATRREDMSWAIDGAELARYLEVNSHRFRPQPVPATVPAEVTAVAADQLETLIAERARADLAEARLADLREALAEMKRQAASWETIAQRLALTAPKPPATAEPAGIEPVRKPWWRRLRRAS
jgi:hypothetical protein